jgi:hypothetical protein
MGRVTCRKERASISNAMCMKDESLVVVNFGSYLLSFCSGYGSISESHVSVESKVLYGDLILTMWLMFALWRLASPQPKVASPWSKSATLRRAKRDGLQSLMLIC